MCPAVAIPVLLEWIVPVAAEEAIVLARAAAVLTAQALHVVFQPKQKPSQPHLPPIESGAPPPPRKVTQGEQNLATKIADQLHQDSNDVGAMQKLADPTLESGTATTEEKVLVDNEALYRTITTKMTAVEAATIAAPGVSSIQYSNTVIHNHWSKQPSQNRDENLVNADCRETTS